MPRSQLPEYCVFHVTAHGVGDQHICVDDSDRMRFELLLRRVREMFAWRLHAWCLMDTHFHLLIEAE